MKNYLSDRHRSVRSMFKGALWTVALNVSFLGAFIVELYWGSFTEINKKIEFAFNSYNMYLLGVALLAISTHFLLQLNGTHRIYYCTLVFAAQAFCSILEFTLLPLILALYSPSSMAIVPWSICCISIGLLVIILLVLDAVLLLIELIEKEISKKKRPADN